MRIDQYHGAVARHMSEQRRYYSHVWWWRLGKLLDAWGEESRKVAAHRGCLPWQVRLFRGFFLGWVCIMLVLIVSGGW